MDTLVKLAIETLAKLDNVSEDDIINKLREDCEFTKNKIFSICAASAASLTVNSQQ